jgi:hypothetical protein
MSTSVGADKCSCDELAIGNCLGETCTRKFAAIPSMYLFFEWSLRDSKPDHYRTKAGPLVYQSSW